MRRHIYLIASVVAHAALLSLLYYHGAYGPAIAAQERQLADSRQLDSHAAMRARVADMEHIKDLLRESLGESGGAEQDKVRFDATSTEETGELLSRAEALAKEIDAIGQRARVDEYAKLAGVDKEHAAAQLVPPEQRPESKPELKPEGASGAESTKLLEQGKALEQARAAEHEQAASAEQQASAQGDAGKKTAKPGAEQVAGAAAPADGGAQSAQNAQSASAAAGAGAGAGTPGAAPANMEARVAALEQRARAVLAQRQNQMERAQQGVRVGGTLPGGAGRDAGGLGVAARIEAFINRDLRRLVPDDGYHGNYHGNERVFDAGGGQIPAVDLAAMRKGSGRVLGAGGEFANRVYVNSWYLIGPFEGKHAAEILTNGGYPPEQVVVLDAVYRGKNGRFLKWRYVQSAGYPLFPPDQEEDSVYYGYTEVMMDKERDLTMWIGADDDAQVWLNDRLAWKGGNINKAEYFYLMYQNGDKYAAAYNQSEGKVRVHFNKGRNKLFFKLSNGPQKCYLSLVLTPP